VALNDDLETLYLAEAWRSHSLDLADDLHGRTCTSMTLARADWLLDAVQRHHGQLAATGALLADDAALGREALAARYAARRRLAAGLQVAPS
jgi:hypothetical protein